MASASVAVSSSDGYGDHHRTAAATSIGGELGLDSEREHDRLYRATLLAVTHGLIVGRSRYGLVVALIEDPADPYSSLAVREGEQGVGHDGQRQGVLIP
jgi:hypothetical protein